MSEKDEEAEWEKTRDIDNPLSPWVNLYKGEIALDFQAHCFSGIYQVANPELFWTIETSS